MEANVLGPQGESLREAALGLKPVKRAAFKDFLEEEYWPYAEAHNKETTIKANEFKVRWLEWFFGEKDLKDISEETIEGYKLWRRKQKKKSHGEVVPKGATINRELKVLSRVCKCAVKRGYLREDPTNTLEYFKEKREKIQIISRDDFYGRFVPHCNAGTRMPRRSSTILPSAPVLAGARSRGSNGPRSSSRTSGSPFWTRRMGR